MLRNTFKADMCKARRHTLQAAGRPCIRPSQQQSRFAQGCRAAMPSRLPPCRAFKRGSEDNDTLLSGLRTLTQVSVWDASTAGSLPFPLKSWQPCQNVSGVGDLHLVGNLFNKPACRDYCFRHSPLARFRTLASLCAPLCNPSLTRGVKIGGKIWGARHHIKISSLV